MSIIATIKNMDIICDDVVDNILLDFLVGDKIHWKKQFTKCLKAITKLPQIYIEARRYDKDHIADMIKVIQFYCMEYFNTRDIYDHTEFYTYYRNNVLPLPRLRNRIVYMK